MPATTREGNILCIGDTIRIEAGPVLMSAPATEELLANDFTASHYQAPRAATEEEIARQDILTRDDQRLFLDALGKPIELGETMHYLDHLGAARGDEGSRCFYAAHYEPMTEEQRAERGTTDADLEAIEAKRGTPLTEDERAEMTMIWKTIGTFPTEEEAISAATDFLIDEARA